MSGWDRPIFTDSGGFQAFSLIHNNPKNGSISERGILFHPEGKGNKILLTPEKTVQLQIGYGTDVVISLDDCTHPDETYETQELSVQRTISWAKKGKKEYERLVQEKGYSAETQPKIFAVIQGGQSFDLRRKCAESLLETGFDGFGFGGWPVDSAGNILYDMLAYVRELIPDEFPLHALGVGQPENIVEAYKLGWDIFDSAMPTRDARHGRMYSFSNDPPGLEGDWFSYIYIGDKKHIKTNLPVYPSCDCLSCQQVTIGYLHHLYRINEILYQRLATIHNLRFMSRLCQILGDTYGR